MKYIIAVMVFIVAFLAFIALNLKQTDTKFYKYVAIGDSYTIGLGVFEEDRWPNILTNNLKKEGIFINLVANPAVSGYTVNDAIVIELPEVEKLRPDFVTVLIGANDSFGQKDGKVYHRQLRELLDKLELMVTDPKNIVLITIPDYTKSPSFKLYQSEVELKLIKEYNEIIKEEAKKRSLAVADIFPISQTMTDEADYVDDGLHPSAQGYLKWEKVIFPVVFPLLRKM